MAVIKGTTGDDLILGGAGGNTLTGDLGADIFELSAINLPNVPNTITDFAPLKDTIQIDLPIGGKASDITTVQTGKDAIINFGTTKLAIVQNTLVSNLTNIISLNAEVTAIPNPTSVLSILGINLDRNLFRTDTSATGFGISAVSQKPGSKVNEIGIVEIDDFTGKIGGIAPGAAGYIQALLNRAKPIFSTLDGSFFSTAKREIGLDASRTYQFIQVQDGSIADLQQQIADGKTPTNVLCAVPDANGNSPIKVTSNSANNGYQVSVNNDELVLNVTKLDGTGRNTPIGSRSQDSPQGRTLDLSDFEGQTLKVDITTTSSATYNNNTGFYAVEDAIGTIKLANGTTLKPGDANYATEAIKSAVLQASKTDSKLDRDIAGGKIYAPVVVAQGSLTDFVDKNPTNGGGSKDVHAYFNYIGANSDKTDHFRLIGNNIFGVEDQYGGGDRDFNDLVITASFKA